MFRSSRIVTGETEQGIDKLRAALQEAASVVIGAGSGISASAGFENGGMKFRNYFGDFQDYYGIHDMYAGGFQKFDSLEEKWAFWSRFIYLNRYTKVPKNVYENLLDLVKDKEYFVITTCKDLQFKKAGFDPDRLFLTKGDLGLMQCGKPCHQRTYDNKELVVKMLLAQGFGFDENGQLLPPIDDLGKTDFARISREVPSELIPYCPVCGEPMRVNIRKDANFVEDENYHASKERYEAFLEQHKNEKILLMDLGSGTGNPAFFKNPFLQWTGEWEQATFVCINKGETYTEEGILDKSILICGDIGEVLKKL